MASLAKADPKRSHSWLWDSHISPKNSKWLEENIHEMDTKVNEMFKIINEEADSFSRKAEMYYKRRPELQKLVEDFFRAYRALAERYGHATKALKQAQRTIVAAFPNEIPTPVSGVSPAGSVMGDDPRTPDDTPRSEASGGFFTPQKDGVKKNLLLPSDFEFLNVRKSLKPLSETFSPGPTKSRLPAFGSIKELSVSEEFDDVFDKAKKLQEKISKLTSENENLMEQVKSETRNSSDVQNEFQMLKASQSKLIFEKEEAIRKFQECLEKVIRLEAELEKFKKINDELQVKANKFENMDEISHLLEEENKTLLSKVSTLEQVTIEQQEQLRDKKEQLEKLQISLQDERFRSEQAEAALGSIEKLNAEAQEKLKASFLEIQSRIDMLKEMELRKQVLEEDIRRVQEENDIMNREVEIKQEELENLNASLQKELARSMRAEAALQSLEKLHEQSKEELQQLILDMQSKVHTLKDVESRKENLETELTKLKEEIRILNEQNVSSQMTIRLLEDEILSIKEANHKLETEVTLHVDGKEKLQKELYILKDEMNILQQKRREITDQMQAVGLDELSFQTSVKELQDGNAKIKESNKRQEDENLLLLKKLEKMEKISEKNTNLEISLLDANVEIDELREKVNSLQVSYEALGRKHLLLVSEKDSMVLKVESITENIGKLLENNTFLENSMSDANYELEELRGKIRTLEESSQSFHDDNSILQGENNMLLSQVDLIGHSLVSLEKKYTELQDKHSALQREKESSQRMISELYEISRVERREHEDFRHSTNARLALLENQICMLCEDGTKKEEKFKEEQFKLLAAQIETFILQQSLCELSHGNMSLSREHHKLEKHIIGQEGKMVLLLELIGRLRNGMHRVLNALVANEDFKFSDAMEESCWKFILNKVKDIQNDIVETEDEKLQLQIENLINAAIIKQLRSELAELKSEKNTVELDYQKRAEQLLCLQTENCNILEINEQLTQNLRAGSRREEALEKEIKILRKQLFEAKEAHSVSQDERIRLLHECQLLSSDIDDLKGENKNFEEENGALLREFVNVDCLSLIFEQFSIETANELARINEELKYSLERNKVLQKEVEEMHGKIWAIEDENLEFKDYREKSEECKSHLTVSYVEGSIFRDVNDDLNYHIRELSKKIEIGDALLILKDKELTDAHALILELQEKDMEMHCYLQNTMAEAEAMKIIRDILQQKIFSLSSDIANRDKDVALANEMNEAMHGEVLKLNMNNETLNAEGAKWSSKLLHEVEHCENEIAALCNDIQGCTVHVAVFENKIHELMGVCEKLELKNMVDRTTQNEELSLRNAHIEDLSRNVSGLEETKRLLESELDEYFPIISSLHDGVSVLEHYIIPPDNVPKDQPDIQVEPSMSLPDISDTEDQSAQPLSTTEGVLELRRLLARIEAIQVVLACSGGHLELHRIDSDDKVVDEKHAGVVILNNSVSAGGSAAVQAVKEEPEKESMTEFEILMEDYKLSLKDIQLDQASSSSKFNTDDDVHLLDVNGNHDSYTQNPPLISHNDTDNIHTESMEGKSEYPSSDLFEKELSIDKMEVPKKEKDLQLDWKHEVIEKLVSDSHRLAILETNMEELKSKVENSEKINNQKSEDFDSVKLKLQEADKDILLLVDLNKKLTKRAEDFPSTSEDPNAEPDEVGNLQRKVSRRARRWSDKIGELELEMQKIQCMLLRLENELESQKTKSSARRKVILRDYLYGRGGGKSRKSFFFWCGSPKTMD